MRKASYLNEVRRRLPANFDRELDRILRVSPHASDEQIRRALIRKFTLVPIRIGDVVDLEIDLTYTAAHNGEYIEDGYLGYATVAFDGSVELWNLKFATKAWPGPFGRAVPGFVEFPYILSTTCKSAFTNRVASDLRFVQLQLDRSLPKVEAFNEALPRIVDRYLGQKASPREFWRVARAKAA